MSSKTEEFEDKHGILGWTDGHDTIRGWLGGLESEADGEGVIAKALVHVTRFPDGTFAAVLSKDEVSDETLREYLALAESEP